MKVRSLVTIWGMWYSQECSDGMGVHRGDIVELAPQHVLRELRSGRVELRLDGPLGRAHEKPNPDDLATVRAEILLAERELQKGR